MFLRTFQEYFSILSHLEVTRSSILTHLSQRTDWNASGLTAKLGYLSGKWLYLTPLLKDWCLLSNRFLKVAFNQMNRVFLIPCFRDYSGCLFDEENVKKGIVFFVVTKGPNRTWFGEWWRMCYEEKRYTTKRLRITRWNPRQQCWCWARLGVSVEVL